MKQALHLTHEEYAFTTIALIAVLTSLTVEAVCTTLAFVYRFPLPFRELIGLPVWSTSVVVYNYIFAKSTLYRYRRKLKLYLPIVGVQIVFLYVFLAFSVGFGYLKTVTQIIVILIFPFIKMYLKHVV
ncbi:hypothetical protein Poli38472_007957 [Pythium oligandrum]|uniref:Uncharacterized protein n=1 Tax=Pythium oligandrum TaxID=41045 RepID=A0A8K1CMG2_PYTOL|nr:hypothetical protein Poli38472_007957 [Pythium oligandrum]|eukprot:TMW65315.1 hypothetical protein Poli38472_007957 [Pythium oligandrum]